MYNVFNMQVLTKQFQQQSHGLYVQALVPCYNHNTHEI
jgi:hypothetical protein